VSKNGSWLAAVWQRDGENISLSDIFGFMWVKLEPFGTYTVYPDYVLCNGFGGAAEFFSF